MHALWLARLGWRVGVLTVPDDTRLCRDERLADEVLPQVQLDRVAPAQVPGLNDEGLCWLPRLIPALNRACREWDVDVILATGNPFFPFLAAWWCRARHRIPYVLDFRDAWSLNRYTAGEVGRRKRRLARGLVRAAERLVVGYASAVLCTSDVMQQQFRQQYPHLSGDRFVVLTNAWDEEELERARWQVPESTPTDRKSVTISYVGTFPPYRSPDPFLRGVKLLVERRPDLRARLVVRFVGAFHDRAEVDRLGLTDVVETTGQTSHLDSVIHMLRSDILLSVNGPEGWMIPAKVFEYLGVQKPILALEAADSAVSRLLQHYERARVVSFDDPESIAGGLQTMVGQQLAGTVPAADPSFASHFTRQKTGVALAAVLESAMRSRAAGC
jgi:glycosyltransferase involved in cell wall biosynthesis